MFIVLLCILTIRYIGKQKQQKFPSYDQAVSILILEYWNIFTLEYITDLAPWSKAIVEYYGKKDHPKIGLPTPHIERMDTNSLGCSSGALDPFLNVLYGIYFGVHLAKFQVVLFSNTIFVCVGVFIFYHYFVF